MPSFVCRGRILNYASGNTETSWPLQHYIVDPAKRGDSMLDVRANLYGLICPAEQDCYQRCSGLYYPKGMIMIKLDHWLVTIGVVVLLAAQLSCEELVYHPDEIQIEKTFRSIVNGSTEADLTKQLGEPTGRIVFDPARGIFRYSATTDPASVQEFRTLDEVKNSPHSELRFLRASALTNTILVFVKGTVHGYFYFGETGRLEDKIVVVS